MAEKLRRRGDRAREGQTLVLFALLSVMLLAGLGLIFDAGLDYSYRRSMQNAADIAALRGARVIAQKAYYAPSMSAFIKTEVENTAVANGVPSAANVICNYLNDSLTVGATCDDGPVPSGVTGVRVRVSETHTPIVMRALGVTTTGTAATAAAQVQMVRAMSGLDVPFMVCGINTAVASGGNYDILQTRIRHDPMPSPSGSDYEDIDTTIAINSGAYSYDWNVRNGDGSFYDYGGPQFIVYGSGVEDCGLGNWYGLVERNNTSRILSTTGSGIAYLNKVEGTIGSVDDAAPLRSINGTQGCKAGQYPNGCVMLLPIAHNEPYCESECRFTSNADRQDDTTSLMARRWGVFYITYDSGSGQYRGRLIKNYPLHTDGVTGWNPATYFGPLNITLVQTP